MAFLHSIAAAADNRCEKDKQKEKMLYYYCRSWEAPSVVGSSSGSLRLRSSTTDPRNGNQPEMVLVLRSCCTSLYHPVVLQAQDPRRPYLYPVVLQAQDDPRRPSPWSLYRSVLLLHFPISPRSPASTRRSSQTIALVVCSCCTSLYTMYSFKYVPLLAARATQLNSTKIFSFPLSHCPPKCLHGRT